MCNTCYSGVYSGNTSGCGSSYGCYNSGCFCNHQRLCRDCCGNIVVYNARNCGCGCGCGCGNNSNSTTQTQNGNGNYRCFTICGNWTATGQNATTATNGGEAYYAAQYALGRNGCSYCCGNNN